jgi:hypothetical protein
MLPYSDPIQEVIEHLDAIGHDQALLYSFMRKNPDFVRWCERIADTQYRSVATAMTPMPAFDTVTALQTAVFDNWKLNPDRRGPYQYGVEVKAYTVETVTNWKRPNWKGSAKMWPAADAVKIAKKSKTKFSAVTMEKIEGLAASGKGYVGVLMHTKPGEGSSYYEEHVVWLDLDGDPSCMVHTPSFQAFTAPFDGRDAKGKGLVGNAVLQSRSASGAALSGWATGAADPV